MLEGGGLLGERECLAANLRESGCVTDRGGLLIITQRAGRKGKGGYSERWSKEESL